MFHPRMDMVALAKAGQPRRYEQRAFRTGPRLVDVLDPHALIPMGTHIVCEAGHAVTILAESIHHGQRVPATAFGVFEPFQGLRGKPKDLSRGIPGQRCGPCLCGREWAGWGGLHTDGGWRPHLVRRENPHG